MNDDEVLRFHRELVAIPSISGHEQAAADFVEQWLQRHGLGPTRFEQNVYALLGERGPLLCLNSHLDTVPPTPSWTRPPHEVSVQDGKVFGLGSNDAKACVAAMTAAALRLKADMPDNLRLLLMFVREEETSSRGSQETLSHLKSRGIVPDAAMIGEPTELDLAIAQKGLLILELIEKGDACHAAHAAALGAKNALRQLAQDLVAIDGVDLGPAHPLLGPVSLQPTLAHGGTARNVNPSDAICAIDIRTNPDPPPSEILERLRRVVKGDLRVRSDRFKCYTTSPESLMVAAARQARRASTVFGSRTMSDLVFFDGVDAVKVGPGKTERSHQPDEFVFAHEVLEGARFYEAAARRYAALRSP